MNSFRVKPAVDIINNAITQRSAVCVHPSHDYIVKCLSYAPRKSWNYMLFSFLCTSGFLIPRLWVPARFWPWTLVDCVMQLWTTLVQQTLCVFTVCGQQYLCIFTVHNHCVMLLVTGNAWEVVDDSDFTVVKTLTQGCQVFKTTTPQRSKQVHIVEPLCTVYVGHFFKIDGCLKIFICIYSF